MSPNVTSEVLLEFKNVSKSFGPVKANDDVSFHVRRGTIHALIGENGAGKSTIAKILFGLYQKDSGDITINGESVHFQNPREAKRAKIGMVHQHFMLADPISAIDHVLLDDVQVGSGFNLLKPLNRKKTLGALSQLSKKYGMPLNWNAKVENLSVGFQQRLELLKTLHGHADILILDEPTAVLTPQETDLLFQQIRELKQNGKTILIVTHKLKEVMAISDDITVFRHGKTVAHRKTSSTNTSELAELMVGRKTLDVRNVGLPMNQDIPSNATLEVRHLYVNSPLLQNELKDIHFSISPSEIVGIAGVEGNGQSELIQVLLHPNRFKKDSQGDIFWNQKTIFNESCRELKEKGLAYFPEDRLLQGALVGATMKENFILGLHRSRLFQKWGWLRQKNISEITAQQMKEFDVRPLSPDSIFKSFSGGNQQKFVVARELYQKPQLLIAAQPTRGVDIGAIERIHTEILDVKSKGGSVLLISSDLDELMKLSDRIVVLFEGQVRGELKSSEFDETKIGCMMTGSTEVKA